MKDKSKAIVRQCNRCGVINAISIKVSAKIKKEFALSENTINVIPLDQARKLWNDFGGRCTCN